MERLGRGLRWETCLMWKSLLIGGLLVLVPAGCGERELSPAEIAARQQFAMYYVAAQLAELEAKVKKPPLSNPSRVVIDHGPASFDPDVVHKGLEIFFDAGFPKRVSSLQPQRYEEGYCDRSNTITLIPAESEELATLLDYFFSKQYAPVYWGGCFRPVQSIKVTWYDEGGAEWVSSFVPDSYGHERPDDALDTLVRSLQARCLTVPMLLESLRDEEACMRNFAFRHIEAGLGGR